jgi:hypothetical protein
MIEKSYSWKTTRRMTPLFPHAVQQDLVASKARFILVPAGRRSGKTERAKRRLIKALFDCHPWSVNYKPLKYNNMVWDDPHFFAAAPTRTQAKNIWWSDLKRMIHPDYIREVRETELTIVTKWNASLSVIGLDRPERMEGMPWDGGVIDELADVKKDAWDANIFPALSERNAWCWLIGVPDADAPGQVQYKKMVDGTLAKEPGYEDWACFSWPSSDILNEKQIIAAKTRMDAQLYAQEYGGEFVLAGGLAFPSFDLKTHVDYAGVEAVYDHLLPLCLSFDFNVNPFCFGVLQHSRVAGKTVRPRVIHEFRLSDSDTNVACNAFLDWYEKLVYKPPMLHVYGDASGNARDSTSGQTDWIIIQKMLRNLQPRFNVPAANPQIKDTVNAVRARLKNAMGEVGLVITPQATQLIKDLQGALWPTDLAEQHSLAWLRYFCHQEYNLGMEVPSTGESRMVYTGGDVRRGRAQPAQLTYGPRVVR